MKLFKFLNFSLVLILLFSNCSSRERYPDVNNIDIEIKIEQFYNDLFNFPSDSVEFYFPILQEKYGEFFKRYCASVIGVGRVGDADLFKNLKLFLDYEYNKEVLDTINYLFSDIERINKDIIKALKFIKYYYPDNELSNIYYHISGFNQSVVVDSSWISVSIEKYLGKDCMFYEWLGTPVYLRKGMVPEKIVPDIIKAYAMTTFPYKSESENLINQMVYNGKIAYFIAQMIPKIDKKLVFNYTDDELKWLKKHESQTWASLVERKHLFSSERTTIQRYVGESPFTYFYGSDSPGQMGNYFGYQIVISFMKNNKDVTLQELMEINDGQNIFRRSKYRP